MFKKAHLSLLLFSVLLTVFLCLAGIPLSKISSKKFPRLIASFPEKLKQINSISASPNQEIVISVPDNHNDYQIFIGKKLENLELKAKVASEFLKLAGAELSGGGIFESRIFKDKKSQSSTDPAVFILKKTGELFYRKNRNSKPKFLAEYDTRYFDDISYFKLLSKNYKKTSNISEELNGLTVNLAEFEKLALASHNLTIVFYKQPQKKNQKRFRTAYMIATEVVIVPVSERAEQSSFSSLSEESSSSAVSEESSSSTGDKTWSFSSSARSETQDTSDASKASSANSTSFVSSSATDYSSSLSDSSVSSFSESSSSAGRKRCIRYVDNTSSFKLGSVYACSDQPLDKGFGLFSNAGVAINSEGSDVADESSALPCQTDSDCSYYACASEGAECSQFAGSKPSNVVSCNGAMDLKSCGYTVCNSDDTCSLVVGNPDGREPECQQGSVGQGAVPECKDKTECVENDDGVFQCVNVAYPRPPGAPQNRPCDINDSQSCSKIVKVCDPDDNICVSEEEGYFQDAKSCENIGEYCGKKLCHETMTYADDGVTQIGTGSYTCERPEDPDAAGFSCESNKDCTNYHGVCGSLTPGAAESCNPTFGPSQADEVSCSETSDCERKICQRTSDDSSATCISTTQERQPGEISCSDDTNCSGKNHCRAILVPNGVTPNVTYTTEYICTRSNLLGVSTQSGVSFCERKSDCSPALEVSQVNNQSINNQSYAVPDWSRLGIAESEKITVEVFHDLRCGMCKRNYDLALKEALGNKHLQIKFREFPLGFRAEEVKLAAAAICAGRQGKYPEFIQMIYADWEIKSTDLSRVIGSLGLDAQAFRNCQLAPETMQQVRKDFEAGESLGIKGTPTYLINGKIYPGAKDYQSLLHTIDSAY